jgi:2-polyprenyl-6-methoxyphenol hydroxylase-like FAD-dependent oxidoreductase
MTSVLISGASVAGTALAYWLARQGFTVTVVERSDGVRPGGQAIDVRGPALGVIDRMGLLDEVAARKTAIRGMSVVDADGGEIMRDTEWTVTGGTIDNPDIEILRDDLVGLLCAAAADDREYLFGDSITGVDEGDDLVLVTFEHCRPRAFDIVIGADGLHSNVRRLAIGSESQFIKRMSRYVAICSMPNFLELDYWQTWYRDEQTQTMAGVYSARANREARAFLGFADEDLAIDYRDLDAQRAQVQRRFAGAGWVVPRIVEAMLAAPDFYFDEMAQIVMERWWSGRVGLVGDAAYCCSPLSGQGTSVALVGAYVLAGELAAADGDPGRGFANYQARILDYVRGNQSLAFDEDTGDPPIPEHVRHQIVNSLTLPDYPDLDSR